MARVAEEGVYSPEMKRSMIGESTALNQAIAQKRKVAAKGQLISSGFGGSIAGQRLIQAPGVQAQRNVSKYAGDITRENMLSRIGAKESLAAGKDLSREQARQESNAYKANLLSILGTTAGYAIGGPVGASIGGRVGGAVGGQPFDTGGVARDIYQDRLSKYRTAQAGYYDRRGGEGDIQLDMNELVGMSDMERSEWALRRGLDPADAKALQFMAEEAQQQNIAASVPTGPYQEAEITPIDTIPKKEENSLLWMGR